MNKRGLFCIVIGGLLLAAAFCLLLFFHSKDRRAGIAADKTVHKLQNVIGNTDRQPFPASSADWATDTPSTPETGTALQRPKTVVVDNHTYMGYLTIQSLELCLPVMWEWNYANLNLAPCRQFGSPSEHNLVIAGHNYRTHFGTLSQIQPDTVVGLTMMDGMEYIYYVCEIEIIDGNDSDRMMTSSYDLTLYTCTYDGNRRVAVRCRLCSSP